MLEAVENKKNNNPNILKNDFYNNDLLLFAGNAILTYFQRLIVEIDGVKNGSEDTEYVHRMRVASRKMRTTLNVFSKLFLVSDIKRWSKKIKKLTESLGSARDLDIQINFLKTYVQKNKNLKNKPFLSRLLLRLIFKRNKTQTKLKKILNNFENSSFIIDMQKKINLFLLKKQINGSDNQNNAFLETNFIKSVNEYGKIIIFQSLNAIFLKSRIINEKVKINMEKQAEKMQNEINKERQSELLSHLKSPFSDSIKLHSLRKSLKSLRYELEIFNKCFGYQFDDFIKKIKIFQTALGDIHDCDEWFDRLPDFLKSERKKTIKYFGNSRSFNRIQTGAINLFDDRKKERIKLRKNLSNDWIESEKSGFWTDLKYLILNYKIENNN
ncbi:MAG TPA: CHAD domain-containing protein [bacterium]|mgnify:CR=1 FL=1|nr:CHAD domain-containing protein [bacterium]HPN31420.1 CHAD domain-containing protein [bacterium]